MHAADMNTSIKKLTRSALAVALGFVVLYISSLIPTGRIALAAIAGLLSAAILMSCGAYYSFAVFIVTAGLGLLILPQKSPAILYAVFLGYYPIIKSYLERIRKTALEWIIKLIIFNIVFLAIWLLSKELITVEAALLPGVWAAFQAAGNIVFVMYDIILSKLIHFYIIRFAKYFK